MVQAINITNTNNQGQKTPPQKAYFSAPATMFPTGDRNYCLFNQPKVSFFVSQGKRALPYLKHVLETSQDEGEIVEALYIIDRIAEKNTKGIPAMYPVLAKFNDTDSPNIQAFLAGIYRKTQVPDAFGPLVAMLVRNSVAKEREGRLGFLPQQTTAQLFDPNEEIGGAILEYIRNYSNNPKVIDYSA
ncbi:MAG: hypothetical protein PHC64_00935 [Candidatus Gastranaerophilales bacterium]|nr:hypothetical protein [Candidatus Gastranaerophilales bacterium]